MLNQPSSSSTSASSANGLPFRGIRAYYISDLHLEFTTTSKMNVLIRKIGSHPQDILILAGDIGNIRASLYKTFLQTVSTMFDRVFVILGNHEYYGDHIAATEARFLEMCTTCNVVGLLNKSVVYNGYKIIGSTLWSKVSGNTTINDTNRIFDMTVNKYNQKHQECVAYIKSELDTRYRMILVMHHLPSCALIDPKYTVRPYADVNEWFATNVFEEFPPECKPHIHAIVFGHTHTETFRIIDGVPMYCNPVGYPGERRNINHQTYFELPNLDTEQDYCSSVTESVKEHDMVSTQNNNLLP